MQEIIKSLGPPIFFCTLILCFEIFYHRKKEDHLNEEAKTKFWSRESKANSVRRKDITFLNYIDIPVDSLPFMETDDDLILEYQQVVKNLSGKRILNLSGMSNTDLKMEYGPANLPDLSQFDENYITLVNTLAKWGGRLFELDMPDEAIKVLEFGIEIDTDVSRNYYLLANEYKKRKQPEEIRRLIDKAKGLDSIMKNPILKKLDEILSYAEG